MLPLLAPLIPLLIIAFFSMSAAAQSAASNGTARVLVYTAVAPGEYVHDSIPTAIGVLGAQGSAGGYGLNWTFSEQGSDFTDGNLAAFDAVMFVSTIGEGA